jgi:gliding motility-associated-like protein
MVLVPAIPALATHQVGGQLEMRAIGDVPGHYRIIVTNYLENGTQGINRQQSTGTVGIFRKRDNLQMMTFTVSQTGTKEPVVYANAFCASQRNLNFVVWTYEATIQLAPGSYSDSQGYYMSYQTRNRNAGINNISGPDQTGFTFYLEFPALQQNGQLVTNSSPHFGIINGEYICLGSPFTFPFGGKDPDGDELRYSMITPLNQKGNGQNTVSAGPYPDVTWRSGFDATNSIPGNPTLSIDAQTGELSVTATELGLYVFAVKVEEYRNGVKIGEVRRDFQFLVIDCPPQTTPDPAVQIQNKPSLLSTTICQGESVVLQAAVNPNWNYQWRQNGINITGATSSSIAITNAGEYMVVVSQKAVCSKVGNSENVTVSLVENKAKLYESGHLCATTGTIRLTAVGPAGVRYQWYRDNQPLSGQTADTVSTTQPGRYWTVLTNIAFGCKTNSDTALLERSAAVVALIKSSSGENRICPGDSLPLIGSGGVSYSWQKDGVTMGTRNGQYTTSKPGTFVLTATDGFGCVGTSPPVVITQLSALTVTLDSIPGVCGIDNPTYTLFGAPPGGDYAGTGVESNSFSPKLADIGNHELTYTVKAAPECAGTVARRIAVVAPIPTIQLADSLTTYTGNTFSLNPVYTGNPNQFQWTSSTYLNDPKTANPTVTSIGNDITYTIDAQNSTGCAVKDTIRITVFARVWVPDAFSPNGDGVNDVLELPGIEAFPDAIITIFNRWGEVIYSSGKGYTNPFDGTLNGTSLPTGVYAYTLSTVPEKPVMRGRLVLIR